jgi:fructokinase
MSVGGIEAGGTRWNCAVSRGDPTDLARTGSFPTTTPAETIGRAVEFFAAEDDLEALGLGLFGPVEVRRDSPRWGTITTTPKPGWADTEVAGALAAALKVPRSSSTPTSTPPRSASGATAPRGGSRRSSTSPSAPGSAAASSPTAALSTA